MKKAYTSPKAKIEYTADIVSTSAEVETGKIPFPGFGEAPDEGQANLTAWQKMAYNQND